MKKAKETRLSWHDLALLRREVKLAAAGAVFISASMGLSGCVVGAVALAGAGAGVGTMAAQERTIGEGVDDLAIDGQVQQALLTESSKTMGRVDVKVHKGRVLLTGVVKTPEDRMRASQLAWDVDQVKEVINEIDVSDRKEYARVAHDGLITSRVRMALVQDKQIKNVNIGVETVAGRVYLFGEARTSDEINRAAQRASAVRGVREVVSYVSLENQMTQGALNQGVAAQQVYSQQVY